MPQRHRQELQQVLTLALATMTTMAVYVALRAASQRRRLRFAEPERSVMLLADNRELTLLAIADAT